MSATSCYLVFNVPVSVCFLARVSFIGSTPPEEEKNGEGARRKRKMKRSSRRNKKKKKKRKESLDEGCGRGL